MGPLSHIQFENHLISICKELGVTGDQNTPIWFTVSGSSTPDRTKSITGDGESSLRHMIHFSKVLESMGADFLVATCNTAHHYLPVVEQNLSIPIVSMIDQTTREIVLKYHGVKKVGILATTGTLQTKLYQKALTKFGIEVVCFQTDSKAQKQVMDAIYSKKFGVKESGEKVTPKARKILADNAQKLIGMGSELIIAGCTEISLALDADKDFLIVDPLKALARKVVALSLGYEVLNAEESFSRFAFHPPD